MPHEKGKYLGSVRTLQDLRERCVVKDCWHYRFAHGRAPRRDETARVTVFQIGSIPVTRAAWKLAGKKLQKNQVLYRACESYDCCNPDHLKPVTRQTLVRLQTERGLHKTANKLRAQQKAAESRRRLTPELVRWLLESQQTGADAAWGLGISQGYANALRAEKTAHNPFLVASRAFPWWQFGPGGKKWTSEHERLAA